MITLAKLVRGFAAAAALVVSSAAYAASPSLDMVLPRSAQRGDEVEVTLRGNRIADAQEVFIYQPGITVTDVKPEGANTVKCKFKVDKDANFGEYQLRLRTATGISELRSFWVGVYPIVKETADVGAVIRRDPKNPTPPEKIPSTFKTPQKIEPNITIAGVLEAEQADFYAIDAKKGQRINVEVEGMRLGQILDTNVTIFDTNRFEIAGNDDNALNRQDAFVSCAAPADGTYIIQVRESSYGGSPNGHYRMHVGNFPRPKAIYPGGGKAGEVTKVQCIGDAAGPFEQTVKAPNTPGEVYGFHAEQNGLLSPTPNPFRVSSFGNAMEAEPNDETGKASVYSGDLPIALNGIIEKEGDTDFWKFKAKKGQALDINVFARRLRTPLDPVLIVYNDKGNQVATNDDSGGPDSYLKFNVPADGEYLLSVRDHLKNGGPEYVYRVEITDPKPSLTLTIPNMGVNYTQDRQWVVVPKGGKFGTTIRPTRNDVGGTLKLIAKDLPPGVRMSVEPLAPGIDMFAVLFEADKDAPVGGKLVELTAKSDDEKLAEIAGQFRQGVELAPNGNQAPYYVTTATKLAVAVAEEAPYAIEVQQPKAPMVQGGLMELKVKATRRSDWKGAINVKTLWDAPGIGAGSLTLNPDQTEGVLTINAQGAARLGKWKTALLASADNGGQTWVASNMFEFEVAAPYLTASIARSTVLQGEKTKVTVKLDQKTDFAGKAKIQLLGLPTEATTQEKEITKDDKEITFDVQTTLKTPAATHNGLLCRVTVMTNGEPVLHNLGNGGVLRVDPIKKPGTPDGTKPKPVAAK